MIEIMENISAIQVMKTMAMLGIISDLGIIDYHGCSVGCVTEMASYGDITRMLGNPDMYPEERFRVQILAY